MIITHKNFGTCSSSVEVEVENDIIKNVRFSGGCSGNLQGIAMLVRGRKVQDVISVLKNIDCNGKGTSCPAQLAEALEEI